MPISSSLDWTRLFSVSCPEWISLFFYPFLLLLLALSFLRALLLIRSLFLHVLSVFFMFSNQLMFVQRHFWSCSCFQIILYYFHFSLSLLMPLKLADFLSALELIVLNFDWLFSKIYKLSRIDFALTRRLHHVSFLRLLRLSTLWNVLVVRRTI